MNCILFFFVAFVCLAFGADPPYGQLSISGSKLKGSDGQDVALHGMSLFWSQWMDKYYNADTVKALKCSWNSNLVRAAMAVDQGGWKTNKTNMENLVNTVVQAAIDQGIYVIIDWHVHNSYQTDAVNFFSQMAKKYTGVPNVLYEIFNEPEQVSWTNNLVPYHTAIINAIRQYDTKNIIIVGTPTWSQDVDVSSQNPITGQTNIAYTLHYYAGSHMQDLRNKAQTAINNGIAIFVTEYGTVNADGSGAVNSASSNDWWTFLDKNNISYANWAIQDKSEGSASFVPGTPATVAGVSSDANLTPSGQLVKAKLKTQNNGVTCSSTSASTIVSTTRAATTPVATTAAASTSSSTTTSTAAATTTRATSIAGASTNTAASAGSTSRASSAATAATTSANASTTKTASTASSATTMASSGSGKLALAANLTKSWQGGKQVNLIFTNNDSKAVCSATFSLTLQSGETLNSIWNVDAGASSTQYKLQSWVNIAPGSKFVDIGMTINANNTDLPTVSLSSYGYC